MVVTRELVRVVGLMGSQDRASVAETVPEVQGFKVAGSGRGLEDLSRVLVHPR